jgi:hypothetical protein
MIDVESLKASIAARAEDFVRELFGENSKRACADKWRVGSHGSLAVEVKDGALVWFSHEDGTGGDGIDLWQRERGGNNGDALKACAAWAGVSPMEGTGHRSVARPKPKPAPVARYDGLPYNVSAEECDAAKAMAHALYSNPAQCQRIAAARGWQAATIGALARECVLGWHDDKLAFIYETGVKLRWRVGDERMIRWHFGKPFLWRHWMLRVPAHRRIIVSEGETDAIRLIDSGMEDDGETAVVALPSASTFSASWGSLFAGKHVVLVLDNDDAGQKHTARMAAMLRPHAATVNTFRWEGLADEAA